MRGVAWLDDGSVVYGASAGGKTAWLRFDPARGDYVPAAAKADETVARVLKEKDPAERLKLLR